MSAIAGVVYRDGRPVNGDDIDRMVKTLSHRGPDGQRSWHEGFIGLGHCLLHTTPESLLDQQPLKSPEGDLCMVADARIDNRDELVKALEMKGRAAATITDAELILAAYRKWGSATPAKLIGDFAFAIWDEQQHTLFCARDPMGVKPFYYHLSDRVFAFGSEMKALLCLNDVPRTLNERTILQYLVGYRDDKEHTFYDGIMRLPPAHALTVSREGVRPWQYWRLAPERELRLANDEAYAEGFQEVFTEAVQCRLRSAFPVGVRLSGGLDSSSIACVARQLRAAQYGEPIKVFSGIFSGLPPKLRTKVDEREYMEAVVAQGGFEPHYTRADLLSPLAGLEEILRLQDEPFFVQGHFLVRAILKKAQELGVRAMLDGYEGDLAVSHGDLYLTELAVAARWEEFATMTHKFSSNWETMNRRYPPGLVFWRYGFKPLTRHFTAGRWVTFTRQLNDVTTYLGISRKQVLRRSISGMVPQAVRRVWRNRHADEPDKGSSLINPQFLKRIGAPEELPFDVSTQREGHIKILESGMLTHALEGVNKLSLAFGVEPRHPFYDRRVLEYCVALPPEQIFFDGWPRGIMRRAMEGILPPKIQWRLSKADHGVNFAYNLIRHEQPRLDKLLSEELDVVRPYINVAAVRKAYREYVSQPTMVRARPLLQVMVLAIWLQRTM